MSTDIQNLIDKYTLIDILQTECEELIKLDKNMPDSYNVSRLEIRASYERIIDGLMKK